MSKQYPHGGYFVVPTKDGAAKINVEGAVCKRKLRRMLRSLFPHLHKIECNWLIATRFIPYRRISAHQFADMIEATEGA